MEPCKILLIQTAFIGDVVLATALIEKLHRYYPDVQLDFLLRKGNEGVLHGHPYLRRVYMWDKRKKKYWNLWQIAATIRHEKYDVVINLQRFTSTGILALLSGATYTVGFDKNPLSRLFTQRIPHRIGDGTHEVDRNLALVSHLTDNQPAKPRVYPQPNDITAIAAYRQPPYVCIAPTSVWFTKQFPAEKWVAFIQQIPETYRVYLLGSPTDRPACEEIRQAANRTNVVVSLAGELSLLASAALMKDAVMNYVNDSAPMHLASAVNAPTCAVFCSTVPAFGFGPLADQSYIVQIERPLACHPCGLHGYNACPEGHFKCAHEIAVEQLLRYLPNHISA